MKKLIKILLVVLMGIGFVETNDVNATSFTVLSEDQIQPFIQFNAPDDIITDQVYNFSSGACLSGGCQNAKYALKSGIQPNTKLVYKRAFKLNERWYDVTYHYKAANWPTSEEHYILTFPINHDPSQYSSIADWPKDKLVPSIEYNAICGANHYGYRGEEDKAEITVNISITDSETGQHPYISNLAFAVADLDHNGEGFSYKGSDLTVYTNEHYDGGLSQDGKLFKASWETESGDGNPMKNTRAVILTSDSISRGDFDITSQMDGDSGQHHLELGGIILIGGTVDVKYVCDNGDDTSGAHVNLSSYNTGVFSGSAGTKVEYDNTAVLQELYSKGFELVKDEYQNNKTYPSAGHKTYYIHLKHGVKEVNEEVPAKRTIRYWFEKVNGDTAATSEEQPVKFTRYWKEDKVTGAVLEGTKGWKPSDTQNVPEVPSPKEDTATSKYGLNRTWFYDRPVVGVGTLKPNDNIFEDVIYYRDRLKLVDCEGKEIVGTFDIIDKETGKPIDENITTDGGWKDISNLVYNKTYIIRQKTTENPYIIAEDTEFTADGSKDITIINTRVKLRKVGAKGTEEAEKLLPGATIKIKGSDGSEQTITTTEEEIWVPNLREGVTYVVEETKAPGGYVISHTTTILPKHTEKCVIKTIE